MLRRSILVYLVIPLSFLLSVSNVFARQQWRFHIAFEDAIGARDTIWLLYDTTATYPGVDTALGEGPVSFNHNIFNVWIVNGIGDSTKTFAVPYTYYPIHLAYVNAFNYQYPITVRWDTSLFHAPFLPIQNSHINIARIDNDYFFLVNNEPFLHTFNMLIADSVVAPSFSWGAHDHFPMIFHLSYDPNIGIHDIDIVNNLIKIFPNPFENLISINSSVEIKLLQIYSVTGNLMMEKIFPIPLKLSSIDISTELFSSGIYIIKFIDTHNKNYYEKALKTR